MEGSSGTVKTGFTACRVLVGAGVALRTGVVPGSGIQALVAGPVTRPVPGNETVPVARVVRLCPPREIYVIVERDEGVFAESLHEVAHAPVLILGGITDRGDGKVSAIRAVARTSAIRARSFTRHEILYHYFHWHHVQIRIIAYTHYSLLAECHQQVTMTAVSHTIEPTNQFLGTEPIVTGGTGVDWRDQAQQKKSCLRRYYCYYYERTSAI